MASEQSTRPWHTEDWFVSPWNFLPEVTEDFRAPDQVRIHDITLRDGEQQAGIIFTTDDKVRIAEKLAEAGVQRIEAGMPVVSRHDEAAIKEIVKRKLGPQIFAFARCMVDDVKRAVDCGVDGVVIEIPVSKELIQSAYQWPLDKAMDLPIKATQYAREQGLYTVFFTIDATRSDMDWYLSVIDKVAAEGHMDALALVDTFGALSPQGAYYYTKTLKDRIDKPIEIHFHNTFGMATANTIVGVLAGGEVIHTTVTGIGEGPGNCAMEEAAVALKVLYGVDTGITFEKLTELSRFVADLAGTGPNRPFVGDSLYDIESGIVASWYKNAYQSFPTALNPVMPRVTGNRPARVVMGKKSGIDSVYLWAQQMGIQLNQDEALEVLTRVKDRSTELKRLLGEDEFRQIAMGVKEGR